jgi:hypothetical protein
MSSISPNQLLSELVENAVFYIDRLSRSDFDDAIDTLVDYHNFLLSSYRIYNEEGGESYSNLGGLIYTIGQEWTNNYRRIIEKSASNLDRDSHFFEEITRIPERLLLVWRDASSPSSTKDILDLYINFAYHLTRWAISRRIGDYSNRLENFDAELLKNTIRRYVMPRWRRVQSQLLPRFEWQKNREVSRDRWGRFYEGLPQIVNHLSTSIALLSLSMWSDDEISVDCYIDLVLDWVSLPEEYYKFNYYYYIPMITSDSISRELEITEASVANLASIRRHLEPEEIASIVVRNLWMDAILVTNCVHIRWVGEYNVTTELVISRIHYLRNRLMALTSEGNPSAFFTNIVLFCMRILTATSDGEISYGSNLDSLIRSADQFSEQEIVAERVYTPRIAFSRRDIQESLVILVALTYDSEFENEALTHFQANLDKLGMLPKQASAAHDLSVHIEKALACIENPSSSLNEWYSKVVGNERTLTTIKSFLNRALDIAKIVHKRHVSSLPVDKNKVEEIRLSIAKAVSNMLWVSPFIVPRVVYNLDNLRQYTFNIGVIDRESILEGLSHRNPSNLPSIVTFLFLRNLQYAFGLELISRYKTVVKYESDDELANMVMSSLINNFEKHDNVVLLVPTGEGKFIDIDRLIANYGDVISINDSIGYSGYICSLGGIPLIGAEWVKNILLVNQNSIQEIRYKGMADDLISIDFTDGEKQGELLARVSMAMEIVWAETPIIEFVACN